MRKHDNPPPGEVELELGDLHGGAAERKDGSGRAPRRRALRLGVVFVALAAVVAALLYSARYAVPAISVVRVRPTPTPVATFLATSDIRCVHDATWDPTSAYIALVGSPASFCAYGYADGYWPHVVNIYRARTGALIRQLRPDLGLFAALDLPQPAPATPTTGGTAPSPAYPSLMYDMLLWSPDGTRLAIRFELLEGSGPDPFVTGLVLLDADGSHERVLVDSGADAPTVYTLWDLQTGAPIPAAQGTTGTSNMTLPPAFSYSWGVDGSLVPGEPLWAGAAPPDPTRDLVGNPDGGQRFGLWQPGQIEVVEIPPSNGLPPAYVYVFTASFDAWSPDGRYIADQLKVDALLDRLGPPLPVPAILKVLQLDQLARLPARDEGLQQALVYDVPRPVAGPSSPAINEAVPLAWRPDGKVLAVLNQHNGVTLRASSSGQVVKSVGYIGLPPEALGPVGAPGELSIPLWSPDGKWLLLPSLALLDMSGLHV